MLASLALIPAAIGVLAPAGPDDGCPSPRMLTDALGAHLPGVVVPLGQPIGTGTLRLGVTTDAAGVTRLDLVDPDGETLLHRTLSPTDRSRAPDCPALAETTALIVERYWHEVGYDLPPLQPPPRTAPPPPPRPTVVETRPAAPAAREPTGAIWSVGAAATGRAGDVGGADAAALLAVALEGRFGLRLSGGVANSRDTTSASLGTASFRRLPFRLGGYLRWRLGPGWLEPGLGVDLDETWVSLGNHPEDVPGWKAPGSCIGRVCVSPGADLALGWAVRSARHVYFRALAQAGVALPYQFRAPDDTVIWSTPRTYLGLALELGAWFP